MKTRESGMPDEPLWETFFDPEAILDALGLRDLSGDVLDVGCGYGTFTLPVARRTRGTVWALDIEDTLIEALQVRADAAVPGKVRALRRDVLTEGSGLPDGTCEAVLFFNILHAEDPLRLLAEARRVLAPGGRVAAIHWVYDDRTPRGPSMAIRPRPEQMRAWLHEAGFRVEGAVIPLPPYHYGLVGIRA